MFEPHLREWSRPLSLFSPPIKSSAGCGSKKFGYHMRVSGRTCMVARFSSDEDSRVFWILREVGTPPGNRYKNPNPKSRMKYGFLPSSWILLFPLPCTLYVRNCLLRWRCNWLPADSRFPCLTVIDSGVSCTWQIDASYTARSPHLDCPSTSRCSSPLGGVLTFTAAHG